MDKNAQYNWQTGRGPLNKLREWVNIPGEKATAFFAPEHERVMKKLREVDDRVRAELTGKSIGGFDPVSGINQPAKDLLKSARKNFIQNEFMTGISELGAFHQKMYEILKALQEFKVDVAKVHHQFLFQDMDDEKLQRLTSHMNRKAELELAAIMIKQAGVMDFFHKLHNVFTPRGRALAAWVKSYPKETKELREKGMKLVEAAEHLYETTLGILKQMATARATRRPDAYRDASERLRAEFNKFDQGEKGFTHYYRNVVQPFIDSKIDIDSQEKMRREQEEAAKKGPLVPHEPPASGDTRPMGTWQPAPVSAPAPTVPDLDVPAAKPAPTQLQLPIGSPPFAPAPKTEIPPAPDTEKDLTKKQHRNFMESLEAMSGEDPRILAKYIAKYASSIQEEDTETAIKLFSIVKRLKG